MPETFLERIIAATRAELAERQAATPLEELRTRLADAPPPRDFAQAVKPLAAGPARLIAEIKRASPSKGLLAERFDPVAQARAYERGGAAAISVLTEPTFFLGALDHLRAVRQAITLPVLRKDFILDPYQVYEARAAGADAILLICALLDDTALAGLLALTHSLGMEALVEAHDEDEVMWAARANAGVIGVNARDLRTFEVDSDIVRRLREFVPLTSVYVAESGIADALGAARARAWGAEGILIGEALVCAPDPERKAHELATAAGGTFRRLFPLEDDKFAKICGLTLPEHGFLVGRMQLDAYGLVFAASRRQVSREQAREIVDAAKMGTAFDIGEGSVAAEEELGLREALSLIVPPLAVGVFVNESPAAIASIAEYVGLDAIQLSGDEAPQPCAEVAARTGLPVIKALRVRTEDDLALLDAYAQAGAALLLDTATGDGAYGGTGTIGDWALARRAAERWPIILSGGLTPENVVEALKTVQPRGVDVSSGVESGGIKDPAKIVAFARRAIGYNHPLSRLDE